MNKSVLWIIGIIVVIIIGFVGYTVNQGLNLQQSLKEVSIDELTSDAEALAGGDCSKIPEIENLIKEIKSSCKNPALKYIIEEKGAEAGQENICSEIKNPENEYLVKLNELKADCP
jgi:peptidoglycan hydrolase CwlO-like protein